jgi:hypothetical protein
VAGYFLIGQLHELLPYFLVIASSSFIYVALADLIPQLQKRLSAKETAAQVFWLLLGIVIVPDHLPVGEFVEVDIVSALGPDLVAAADAPRAAGEVAEVVA